MALQELQIRANLENLTDLILPEDEAWHFRVIYKNYYQTLIIDSMLKLLDDSWQGHKLFSNG